MNPPNTEHHKGAPKSVQIDLKDGAVELEEPDMYVLTETSSAILNELIAYTGREEMKELKKSNPDPERLEELDVLFKEVHTINREPANFGNQVRMQEIIDKYAPKVREIYGRL
ncbi:MAG: hypothetical protein WC716_15845 [Chitinophagaceae bacterium]|jgi:hypothetical protein